MFFLLRAFLVIGVLTYFASQQRDPSRLVAMVASAETASLPAAWNALPAAARDRITQQGSTELVRRLVALKPSQDTLGDSDRRPAWRGASYP